MQFFFRLFLVLSLGSVLTVVKADPVVAFTNIPPPGNFKPGGSTLNEYGWKALLFTTPTASNALVSSVTVGLSCGTCIGGSEPYPTTVDLQITIYSVANLAGVPTPDTELFSIPMQYGLNLLGRGSLFTFPIPNWNLSANTSYALVLKSTGTGPLKWGNIEVNSVDTAAVTQNGFSFSTTAFATDNDPNTPLSWISTLANNNGVQLNVILVPAVPTLSEWSQILLALMTISAIGWHFIKQQV